MEYRIDDGEWVETTYSTTPSEIGALTPFEWHILLEPKKLTSGNHTVEEHAVAGAMHSLPVFFGIVSNLWFMDSVKRIKDWSTLSHPIPLG